MMPKCAHVDSDTSAHRDAVRLTRCFVPGPLEQHSQLELPAAAAAHVTRVLRLRVGAALRLFDGTGGECDADIIAIGRRGEVSVRIGQRHPLERESPLRTLLLQCLVRGERMDWILQKATELGVSEILPVSSRHGVVQLDPAAAARRRDHWMGIVTGACEQCGRNRLPCVHDLQPLEIACAHLARLPSPPAVRLLLDPRGEESLAQAVRCLPGASVAGGIALLVGPEGGLSDEELAIARQGGFRCCRIGPRVLRAETAPLAALACLQALQGDLA